MASVRVAYFSIVGDFCMERAAIGVEIMVDFCCAANLEPDIQMAYPGIQSAAWLAEDWNQWIQERRRAREWLDGSIPGVVFADEAG